MRSRAAVARQLHRLKVVGSNPASATIQGRYRKQTDGEDCKSVGYAFVDINSTLLNIFVKLDVIILVDFKKSGKRLKILRLNKRLTPKAVCDSLHINESVLQNLENGNVPISSDILRKLANMYSSSEDYILYGDQRYYATLKGLQFSYEYNMRYFLTDHPVRTNMADFFCSFFYKIY